MRLERFGNYLVPDNPRGGTGGPEKVETRRQVGEFVFGNGEKGTKVFIDQNGQMVVETSSHTPGAELEEASCNLSEYDKLRFVIIGLTPNIEVTPVRRSTEKDFIVMDIHGKDALTAEETNVEVLEGEMLDALTGKSGGMIELHPNLKTVQMALLIEDKHTKGEEEKKTGTILLFHPEQPTQRKGKTPSEFAVNNFFTALGDAFEQQPDPPLAQTMATEELRQEVKRGAFKKDYRTSILRAMAIAHARRGEYEFMDEHLPDWRFRNLAWLLEFSAEKLRDMQDLDLVISAMKKIFMENKPSVAGAKASVSSPDMQIQEEGPLPNPLALDTDKAIRLRDVVHRNLKGRVGSSMQKPDSDIMQEYVKGIVRFVARAKTIKELDDAEVLLQELNGTLYVRNTNLAARTYTDVYVMNILDTNNWFVPNSGSDEEVPLGIFLNILEHKRSQKKAELVAKDIQTVFPSLNP